MLMFLKCPKAAIPEAYSYVQSLVFFQVESWFYKPLPKGRESVIYAIVVIGYFKK